MYQMINGILLNFKLYAAEKKGEREKCTQCDTWTKYSMCVYSGFTCEVT